MSCLEGQNCADRHSVRYPDHYAPQPSRASQAAVIYLPRGPLLNNPKHDDLNLDTLQRTLSSPVICINYRCGNEDKYPTAIHDVIAGYDWVVQNLFNETTATNRFSHHERTRNKIAVLGELIGGSLATTLALTECRAKEPAAVVAAAINNPIADWVDLDEDERAKPCLPDQAPLTLQQLHRQRDSLFRQPADYFDPFVSPALFFRAAGLKVPASKPPLSDMEELAELEKQDFFRSQLALSAIPNAYASMETALWSKSEQETSRKSSRRYPSKSLAIQLPRFRITSGRDSVIAGQSKDLKTLLDKAVERQSKPKGSPANSSRTRLGMCTSQTAAVSEMVSHEEVGGSGLWDESEKGRSRMRDAALWVEQALR